MRYHIVLSRPIDLDGAMAEARKGLRPRHSFRQLADRLNAAVHSPSAGQSARFTDKLKSQLVGSPELWTFARNVAAQMTSQDVLYCPDEAIGLPLAAVCNSKQDRPKLGVMVHNVDRPRTRVGLRLVPGAKSADLFFAVSQRQLQFLQEKIGIPANRTVYVDDQTDRTFFKPGPPSPGKTRPLLVGAGLEKRDYRVLAEAVAGMDVDVAVTGFSADAAPGRGAFPDIWPGNVSRRRYEWCELAQLYRDADAVVVTLIPNNYAAGITTMVEGMASGRPIIVTSTEGLQGYLDDCDAMTVVPPSDGDRLRQEIDALLASPERAAAMGRRAAEIAEARYGSETHVENIATALEGLH